MERIAALSFLVGRTTFHSPLREWGHALRASCIAAYKTPFPLAVSITPQSAMSLRRSLASNTPAMASTLKAPKFYTSTFAVNHTGFHLFLLRCSPKPLAVMLAPITWCSNRHPSLTFIAMMQECALAQVPQ